jgi:cbb3-type cytochrome oxidase maturation protein
VNAILWLIPVAVGLGAVFVVLFLSAVKDGQFDDLDDPPRRILQDDD